MTKNVTISGDQASESTQLADRIAEKLTNRVMDRLYWHDASEIILAELEPLAARLAHQEQVIQRWQAEELALWKRADKSDQAKRTAEARLSLLEKALEHAGDTIHSEFCGTRGHHAECQAVAAVLASSPAPNSKT